LLIVAGELHVAPLSVDRGEVAVVADHAGTGAVPAGKVGQGLEDHVQRPVWSHRDRGEEHALRGKPDGSVLAHCPQKPLRLRRNSSPDMSVPPCTLRSWLSTVRLARSCGLLENGRGGRRAAEEVPGWRLGLSGEAVLDGLPAGFPGQVTSNPVAAPARLRHGATHAARSPRDLSVLQNAVAERARSRQR
jgi:hypothetical protein